MSCTRAKRSKELEETDSLTRTGATENEQKTDNERQNEAKETTEKTNSNKQAKPFLWMSGHPSANKEMLSSHERNALFESKKRLLHSEQTPFNAMCDK